MQGQYCHLIGLEGRKRINTVNLEGAGKPQ